MHQLATIIGLGLVLAALGQWQLTSGLPANNNTTEEADQGISLTSERIFVEIGPQGEKICVDIQPGDTVSTLKNRITEAEGFPAMMQQLFLEDGALLGNERLLSECGVRANSTLVMSLLRPLGTIMTELTVRTLAGQTLLVPADLSGTIGAIKEELARLTGVAGAQQRLLLQGRQLRDERRVLDYEIWNETVLELGKPLEACRARATITLRTLSGATRRLLDIELDQTVAWLKERIERQLGVSRLAQILVANEVELRGHDLLCDYGLEPGSHLLMALHSERVRSDQQVGRLVELGGGQPELARPNSGAPVLREHTQRASLYKDARNWISGSRPTSAELAARFEPRALLCPDPDDQIAMDKALVQLRATDPARPSTSGQTGEDTEPGRREDLQARLRMASLLRRYRTPAGVKNEAQPRAGIELGSSWQPTAHLTSTVPLGADLSNYAPDAFRDSELAALFEFGDRVRARLESDARTGAGTLGVAKQRELNQALLRAYVEAVAGFPLAAAHAQPADDEECAICRDELASEPAIKLACGHTFHEDCALHWYRQYKYTNCPYCRRPFRFALETFIRGADLPASMDE